MEDWRTCPACKRKRDLLKKELDDKYGRVTKEEYSSLQEEFEKAVESDVGDATMRIEYEYHWDDDANAIMTFMAFCKRCNSKWDINVKTQAEEVEDELLEDESYE
jgi:hypothetical protein